MSDNLLKYKEKFFNLLESKSGDVKPLLSEEATKIFGNNKLKNFVAKLKSSDSKIKNWVVKTFGKETPTEQEVATKLKENPPEVATPATPTTETQASPLPTAPIMDAIPQTVSETFEKKFNLINESTSNYFDIWNKNQDFVLSNLNYSVTNYILPYVNEYIKTNVISKVDTCVDLYVAEVCIGVEIKITNFKINSINLWDGADYNSPDYTLVGLSVSCTVLINVEGIQLYVYPSATCGAAIYKNQVIGFSSPDISLTTSKLDVGIGYAWLENNNLKVYNSLLGTYNIDLGITSQFKTAFKGKTIDLKNTLPNLYNLTV